jgi:chromate transporter
MLPIMERVVCGKKRWLTTEELTDLFAIGQVFPGVLAVNTATFVGLKQKGVLGGIAAALGVITPSLTIVTIIALFFDTFIEIELVRNALSGIFIAACALIVSAVYKLFKACMKTADKPKVTALLLPLLLFGGAFAAIAFLGVSPVLVVALTAAIGILTSIIGGRRRRT